MNKPLVSVIIPAFNEEKYLDVCLSFLKKQTYKNVEIIVIDNNSTDKTAEIARKAGVVLVSEMVQGMTYSRETGFKKAKGEIIARTDADTRPPNDWIEKIIEEFDKDREIISVTGPANFYDLPNFISFLWHFTSLSVLIIDGLIMGHFPLNGPNFAVKKTALADLHPHMDNKQVHEDMDLACHLAPKGKIGLMNVTMPCSARRLKRGFYSTLFEYTVRGFRTIFLHHPLLSWNHKATYST